MSDQQRAITNDDVFVSALEPVLWSGCDFRLFWCVVGLGTFGAIFLVAGFGLISWVTLCGLLIDAGGTCAAIVGLRVMARRDPHMVPIYLRHIQWPDWLPATGRLMHFRPPKKLFRGRM